jgi:hypothetical protein
MLCLALELNVRFQQITSILNITENSDHRHKILLLLSQINDVAVILAYTTNFIVFYIIQSKFQHRSTSLSQT